MTDELARIFRVTLVTTQIPPPPDEDEERLRSACACLVCRFPTAYVDSDAQVKRAMHLMAHADFDRFLDERNARQLEAMGVEPAPRDPNDPSDNGPAQHGACRVHPGVPAHPVHE